MEIYHQLIQHVDDGQSVALLLVVGAVGSTPQSAGAKGLVDQQGAIVGGTIGGGLMEARVAAEAASAVRDAVPRLVAFPMDEAYGREAGPICGGTMRILVRPCSPGNCQAYRSACAAAELRQRGWLLTTLSAPDVGVSRWVAVDEVGDAAPSLADALRALLTRETAGTVRDPSLGSEVFAEVVAPAPRMLIVGGGHVGQALARHAVPLGFDVTVLDDREEQADPSRFPAAVQTICGDIAPEVARFPKQRDTYIVLVSKGHKPDAEALEQCLSSDVAYLGMIGSGRKVALLRRDFLEKGLATASRFDQIFAPIGLGIGAVTVEEIATSIMAQVVAVRRGVFLPGARP